MDSKMLNTALELLGSYLLDTGMKYEVVAIGGGALLLLGCIIRPTQDLDIVAMLSNMELVSANPLPRPLLIGIELVGAALNLSKDWINSAPADLLKMGLPEGFQNRLEPIHYGGLTLYCASRLDQVYFKLYASVDQGPDSKHFSDLKRLKPTQDELENGANWCKTHDVSEEFAITLAEVLHELRK